MFKRLKIFISSLFFLPVMYGLKFNYLVATPLTFHEIFQKNTMNLPVSSDIDVDNLKKEPLNLKYMSRFSGIKVDSELKIHSDGKKISVCVKNRFLENIVTFEKVQQDMLHIQVTSNLQMKIPEKIHFYIIKRKINEIIENIQKMVPPKNDE